jgi:MFS family permease
MMLATSLAPLGSTMIAVAIPRIAIDLGASVSNLTPWLVSSYLVTSIALQSPGGKVGDRIGHSRALLAGLALVATGSAIGLLGSGVRALGLARILMASGGAATVPATMAILRNSTPADRRARVFGLFGACMGLAAAIGPLAGGELTERIGWRAVFAANLPVVAVATLLILSARHMFARVPARTTSFDWPGTALLTGGLTAGIVALQSGGSRQWWLGGVGLALLLVFPVWERRAPSPIVDFSLLRRPAFVAGGAIVGLQNLAMYPLLFQLPVFFDRVRGLGARAMGQALLALTVAMMSTSIAGGRLAERIGARTQAVVGSLLALGGLWWFSDFSTLRAPGDILPGLVLLGAGVGLTSPPAQAAAMGTVSQGESGMAGGVLSTLRYLGGVAGTSALGVLLLQPDVPASHQRPVVVYAVALVAAALLALRLPGRHPAASRD